jgi:hypothetical protein
MALRSLLVKGAVAGALAAGSLGITAVAAHASGDCTQYFYLQGKYYDAYRLDYQNYQSVVGTAGGDPAAGYYYDLYQADYSTYLFYTSKVNSCNLRQP